jgi:Zn-dependent metalloprotease
MAYIPHPVYCIIPPHMLSEIVAHGSDYQRDKALQAIHFTDQFRNGRIAMKPRPAGSPAAVPVKQRTVYSAEYQATLPGKVVRQEGEPPTLELATDEAFDGAGATYDLYWQIYQRNSIDGNGMRLDSTVHYQKGYDNAFWNGEQMVYGDGDEDLPADHRLFNRFTIALDVIGHELTHGVTQYTANLTYMSQSGALNESISDIFGSLVKQKHLGQTARDADWIIGEGLFTPNVKGVGIRSMKAPGSAYDDPVLGKDPQPDNMKNYINTLDDNGGVHLNSGIPNHAFYLAAIEIGGFAWDKAGKIWYTALRDKFQASSNFQDAANQTYTVAGDLYGQNSLEQQAVAHGWSGAGINVLGAPTPAGNGCLPGILSLFKIKQG